VYLIFLSVLIGNIEAQATPTSTQEDLQIVNCLLCQFKSSYFSTSYAFCTIQRATAQSKTGIFHHGVAEAPPVFQAGCRFSCSSGILESTVPYRSSAEFGVSFVALGILESQAACYLIRPAAISRNLPKQLEGHYSEVLFNEFGPSSFMGTREVEDCRPSNPMFFLALG
jgi:hypothetical protein